MTQERNPRLKELPGIKYRTYGSKQGQEALAYSDGLALRGSKVHYETLAVDEEEFELLPAEGRRLYLRLQNVGSKIIYVDFGDEKTKSGTGFKLGVDDELIFDEILLLQRAVHVRASSSGGKLTYISIDC